MVQKQDVSVTHRLPFLRLGTGEDGLANREFIMAVLESAEGRLFFAGQVRIDADKEVL